MLFNSWGYLLFLAVFCPAVWFSAKARQRQILIAIASFVFYAMWRFDFAFLVLFSAAVDFFAARKIHEETDKSRKKRWLFLSLFINLGLLVFFKYSGFLWENLATVLNLTGAGIPTKPGWVEKIILPLGISFYTFQTVSYSIDVYRGVAKPVDSFVLFVAYVMFWPQLVAGPILRAGEVIPELENKGRFNVDDFNEGFQQVIRGLFKKVVLADHIGGMVDRIFKAQVDHFVGFDAWTATILFGFQIYFDFSGYSDIAIGCARMLGFRFPANFNWPYVARSPREFWARWHISLGSWIRDYLYLPLTGAKFQTKSEGGLGKSTIDAGKANRALWLTWLIMGFWHGAGWNFAIWGLYHALTIWLWRKIGLLRKMSDNHPIISTLVMYAIAMLGWIPFRAQTVKDTVTLYGKIFNPFAYRFVGHRALIYDYAAAAVLTAGMFAAYLIGQKIKDSPSPVVRGLSIVVYGLMLATVAIFVQQKQQFIYFQF